MPFQLLRDEENQYEFAVFTPENFGSLNQAPIIVFLHGSGERGWDPGLPLKGNAHVFENLQLPAAVIFPQCDSNHRAFYGEMEKRMLRCIDVTVQQLGACADKMYLAGYSMGGSSNLWIAAKHPEKFRAIICIAPGITWMGEEPPPHLPEEDMKLFESMFVVSNRTENIAKNVASTPIWFLQGTEDEPCPIEETRELVNDLRKLNAQPILTEYEGLDHETLTIGLEEEGLFPWLFSHA
ncbi:MAG TPA: hypothetical protein EYN91_12060 [Candidatus Melainabacteria bacterium]|nr:hypothetical protein [Candidatus Melainabacteria bacterium]